MKRCTKCGIEKELKDFAKDKGQKSGLKCSCRACFRAYKQDIKNREKIIPAEKMCCRCKVVKPASDFYKSAHQQSGLFSSCRDCEKSRIKRAEDIRSAYWKKYYRNKTQEKHLLRKYGIDKKTRQEMLKNQNGLCAICGKSEDILPRILVVDHCHNSSKVRGLLCQLCNTGLGAFEDDIARVLRAASYLSGGGVGGEITAHER